MTTILRAGLRSFAGGAAVLLWQFFGLLPPGPRVPVYVGRHRLDAMPVHQGYADQPERLAELVEQRGRHAG
jgi:hypothetical protein